MLTLFQESVPFTNKQLAKEISKDGLYTNPVIIPYAFDLTSNNILETVIYIKNNDQAKWYKNVVVSLMKENTSGIPTPATGVVYTSSISEPPYLLCPGSQEHIAIDCAYEGYDFNNNNVILQNAYMNNYIPITNDGTISVKFSYEYDEISNYTWTNKKSAIIIPYIGNSTTVDMTYIPIRMRINLLSNPSIVTLRDYFVDISYESENMVTG